MFTFIIMQAFNVLCKKSMADQKAADIDGSNCSATCL